MAVFATATHAGNDLKLEWWQASIAGGVLGYGGAMLAWCMDLMSDKSRSQRTRVIACFALIFGGLAFCIAAVIVIDVLIGKR